MTLGLTDRLALVCPVLQTKELAPLAVRVADPPGQITDGDAFTVTTGLALTVTETLAVAEQPLAFVPVTV